MMVVRREINEHSQSSGTQGYQPTRRSDEDALAQAILLLAFSYCRYGYRRIAIKLLEAG